MDAAERVAVAERRLADAQLTARLTVASAERELAAREREKARAAASRRAGQLEAMAAERAAAAKREQESREAQKRAMAALALKQWGGPTSAEQVSTSVEQVRACSMASSA
eukprot:SAG31_NODE_272_length_18690_cov_14.520785_18_plen_110_part_00